jgi:hypothetical protein
MTNPAPIRAAPDDSSERWLLRRGHMGLISIRVRVYAVFTWTGDREGQIRRTDLEILL